MARAAGRREWNVIIVGQWPCPRPRPSKPLLCLCLESCPDCRVDRRCCVLLPPHTLTYSVMLNVLLIEEILATLQLVLVEHAGRLEP